MDIDWYSTYLCADGGISPVIGISIRMSTNVCHLIARLSNGNQNAGCYLLARLSRCISERPLWVPVTIAQLLPIVPLWLLVLDYWHCCLVIP